MKRKEACPHCGYEEEATGEASPFMGEDEEIKAKDDVLAELLEMLDGSLGTKLERKKPSAMSVEMSFPKGKEKDEEDEDEY